MLLSKHKSMAPGQVFHAPDKLKPGQTCESITIDAANRFADIANAMNGNL